MNRGKHRKLTLTQLGREAARAANGKPNLYGPRWKLSYNNARARAVEAGGKPGVAMEVKR